MTICKIRSAFMLTISILFYTTALIVNLATKLHNRGKLQKDWISLYILLTKNQIFCSYSMVNPTHHLRHPAIHILCLPITRILCHFYSDDWTIWCFCQSRFDNLCIYCGCWYTNWWFYDSSIESFPKIQNHNLFLAWNYFNMLNSCSNTFRIPIQVRNQCTEIFNSTYSSYIPGH